MKGFRHRKLDRIRKERNYREVVISHKLKEIDKLRKEVDKLRVKQIHFNISTLEALHLAFEEEHCDDN